MSIEKIEDLVDSLTIVQPMFVAFSNEVVGLWKQTIEIEVLNSTADSMGFNFSG
jgi:hypothetical protein